MTHPYPEQQQQSPLDALLDQRGRLRQRQEEIEAEVRLLRTEATEVRGELAQTDAKLRELSRKTPLGGIC
jgi:chromosome segregation ATPase